MLICISDVLSGQDLASMRDLLSRQQFVDGRESAGWAAAPVKSNRQLAPSSPDYAALQGTVADALKRSKIFTLAAVPKMMRPLLFSRYEVGMSYGPHVDNALMGENPAMRTDLAFTLFLSEPHEYEGGALVIDEPVGEREFKLPAGSLVLYPANSLHRVAPVTAGCREVVVGWVQSMLRDAEQRRIIFELETLRMTMFQRAGKTEELDLLTRNTSSLWRMWAEP